MNESISQRAYVAAMASHDDDVVGREDGAGSRIPHTSKDRRVA